MTNRNIGLEILDGLNEIKELKKGNITLKAKTLESYDTLPTKNVLSWTHYYVLKCFVIVELKTQALSDADAN